MVRVLGGSSRILSSHRLIRYSSDRERRPIPSLNTDNTRSLLHFYASNIAVQHFQLDHVKIQGDAFEISRRYSVD
jgi:hypothetical protein